MPNGVDYELIQGNQVRVLGRGVMSTKTGLLYTYIQDPGLANRGIYKWYIKAVNWETSQTEQALRTGAGGSYDSEAQGNILLPDRTLYQGVHGGIVAIRDHSQL